MLPTKFWISFSLVIACGALIYILSTLFWGINRGFEIMDEGFYLLTAKYPHYSELPFRFSVWLALVPPYTVSRVLDLRYAQIICQLLGSALLTGAYLRALKKLDVLQDRVLLVGGGIFSLMGSLLYFAKSPFSLSYNSLTGLFLFSATALIIDAAPYAKPFCTTFFQTTSKKNWKLFAAGIFSALSLSTKFSSCLVFTVSALVLIVIVSGRGWRTLVMPYITGIVVSLIFMCTFIFDPIGYWKSIQFYTSYLAHHQAPHGSIMSIYSANIASSLEYFSPYLLQIAIGSFVGFFLIAQKKPSSDQRRWSQGALLLHTVVWSALVFGLIQKDCLHNTYFSGNAFFVICIVLACETSGFHFGQSKESKRKIRWRVLVLQLALVLLPVICSVGTANGLLFQCSLFLTSIFLLLCGMSALLNEQIESKLPTVLSIATCSILAMFQFYDGFVRHPYDLPSRLNTQTNTVSCKNLRGLRLAPDQAKFIQGTYDLLSANGFKDGDDILAFYNLPGLVYAVGGNSPGLSWYLSFAPYFDWNRIHLKNLQLAKKKRLYLIAGWKLNQSVIAGLNEAGVKFPTDFKLLGSVHNPNSVGTVAAFPDPDYMNGVVNVYELAKN